MCMELHINNNSVSIECNHSGCDTSIDRYGVYFYNDLYYNEFESNILMQICPVKDVTYSIYSVDNVNSCQI